MLCGISYSQRQNGLFQKRIIFSLIVHKIHRDPFHYRNPMPCHTQTPTKCKIQFTKGFSRNNLVFVLIGTKANKRFLSCWLRARCVAVMQYIHSPFHFHLNHWIEECTRVIFSALKNPLDEWVALIVMWINCSWWMRANWSVNIWKP